MNDKIFKIVKIINEYRVVINAGKEDEIHSRSKFEIYQEGEPVIDPDTKENLGTLDCIKATVEVVDLFPRMCVCRNTKTTTTPSGGMQSAAILSAALAQYSSGTEPARLNINVEDISGGFEDADRKIHVGDKVRLV